MKLTDICDFQGGSQPPKNQWSDEPKEGYIRMLQIRDFTQDNSKVEYVKITNSTKKCEEKDILIARYGASIGKILTGLSGAYNVAMMKVIIDENIVDRKFIYNFLKSDVFQNYIKNVGQRAAQAGFNKGELSKININLPTLKEQKNVGKELDKVQEIINIKEKQIELLDELIKSQFVEMFGEVEDTEFPIYKLNQLTNLITDGVHKKPIYTETGTPFISVVNITTGELKFEDCKYISDEDAENYSKRCKPEEDDILYTKVGATYGRSAIVNTNKNFSLYVSVCLIKPKRKLINPIFLNYTMRQPYVKNQADKCIKGIGVPDLHLIEIKNFDIIVPPIELQNQFAEIVKQIDKQKFEMESSLEETQKLQESLMNKYFG